MCWQALVILQNQRKDNMKKSVFFAVLFLTPIINCSDSCSQAGDFRHLDQEQNIIQKIKEASTKIHSIQCDFSQIKKMQYLDSDLKSSGQFWYVYPDKVRWEYMKPYEYKIILNKGKISLISSNTTNEFEVSNNETFKKMNEMIVSAVSGKVFDNSDYQTKISENDDFYRIELQPGSKEITEMIRQLELYFDKHSFALIKLKIVEPNDDYSLIHFSNQVFNESITENIFIP